MSINLKIMSPDDGVYFDEDILYLDVNTLTGHIGVQQGIIPMIAILKNSNALIKFTHNSSKKVIICGGTLFVDKQSGIKIFTKGFSYYDEIDVNTLTNEINELEQKINSITDTDKNYYDYLDLLNKKKNYLEGYNTK